MSYIWTDDFVIFQHTWINHHILQIKQILDWFIQKLQQTVINIRVLNHINDIQL